ncbi:hypothetical protein EUA93_16775 [Nocardioides oleivorans]|uniref:Htaa domain-containing protein n=1 Tax=Nocardioides oleivorans TaxID=273676 RepID=A0A4Q2RRZ8_9ACTN|nr:hypothetical protein [Nocardioides oleivorans]RYB91790.1 hypothetical protein EUA93_16775 [Nocardioides oleivorans]
MRLRNSLGIVASGVAVAALWAAPAHAESRTLSGPTTGDPDTFLTYVSCDAVFGQGVAPQSRINLGPYSAPLGRRSLGIVPASGGSASGPYSRFGSLAGIDTSLSVAATAGTQGVSYVVAITADSPAGTAWAGRADVTVPAGGWTQVSSAELTYDWSLVDLRTRKPVSAAGSATPAGFAGQHGDGAGFTVTGFGCDSRPFNLDAVRAGGSTFDFEGLSLSTTIGGPVKQVDAGAEVTLTGRVADGNGRVTGDPLVLESRTGNGAWAPVGGPQLADADGLARVVVPVAETTEFRWHRPQSQYADEGWSDAFTVTVAQATPSEAPAKK